MAITINGRPATDYELVVAFVPVGELDQIRLSDHSRHAHIKISDPGEEKVIGACEAMITYLHNEIWPDHTKLAQLNRELGST